METNNEYTAAWEKLVFTFFHNQERRHEWEKYAFQALKKMSDGNLGIIGDTASGKTVIALLIILASGLKTLFLVPQKVLALQHNELYGKISGWQASGAVMIGDIIKAKRDWSKIPEITFATPQTALNDIRSGKLKPKEFSLIILDEFHRSVGNYDYTHIGRIANYHRIKLIGLTASPGDSRAQIKKVKDNCFIKNWLFVDIKTPALKTKKVIIQPDERLLKINALFGKMLAGNIAKINALKILPAIDKDYLSIKEIKILSNKLKGLAGGYNYYRAISLTAQASKLSYAYSLAITESYAGLLKYGEQLALQTSKSAKEILTNPDWQTVAVLAGENVNSHPKTATFLDYLHPHIMQDKNALIFVRTKELGRYLLELARCEGLRGEFVFGGRGKDAGLIRTGLKKLADKEIEFLIATSVAEEGLSVSQVNAVFHYSVPATGITRLQRSGRTGRDHPGEVFYFVVDHALDNNLYWKSLKAVSTMKKEVVRMEAGQGLGEQAVLPLKITKIKPKNSIKLGIKKSQLKKAETPSGQMPLFKKSS